MFWTQKGGINSEPVFKKNKKHSTFVGSVWSFGFFITATTANDFENSWERASIFPFKCSVLNKGTTGTIFITISLWRGPWLGIEPGTSHTQVVILSGRYNSMLSSLHKSSHYFKEDIFFPIVSQMKATIFNLTILGGFWAHLS